MLNKKVVAENPPTNDRGKDEEPGRENIIKSILKPTKIFQGDATYAIKKAEALFPKTIKDPGVSTASYPIRSLEEKKKKIKAFLPPPSGYIIKVTTETSDKKASNDSPRSAQLQEPEPSSGQDKAKRTEMLSKCEKILAGKLGNYVGFFDYEKEDSNNALLFSSLLDSGKFEMAIRLLEKKVWLINFLKALQRIVFYFSPTL
jgi:hypothetical protein